MLPQALLTLLLGTALPVLGSSPDAHQTVFSTPPPSDAPRPKFSTPFKPLEYVPHQHMARCQGVNRTNPHAPIEKNIQLRESSHPTRISTPFQRIHVLHAFTA
jgi:hypothetical protein